MRYFSMFSGIGGFEKGIEQSGVKSECIGYSEIDKYAIKVYERQFNGENDNQPKDERLQAEADSRSDNSEQLQRTTSSNRNKGHKNYGDATTINAKELPDFDLLVGGFPCQAFSVAGKRAGFNDTRGTLFFDIARILAEKRPRHILLENVKGLLSHDKGKTLQTIIGVLSDIGYRIEWQVLNSKHHGVPQNRERIFIVGHLRGECRRQVFPIIPATGQNLSELTNGVAQTARIYDDKGVSPTLSTMQGGQKQPKVVQLTERRTDEAKKIRRESMKNGKDWSPRRGKELVPRDDDMANTLPANQSKEQFVAIKEATTKGYMTTPPDEKINRTVRSGGQASLTEKHNWDTHLVGARIRRLTPTECMRLQGFPDDWCDIGSDGVAISDTQKYKMAGNAVTVNVVERIITEMQPCLAAIERVVGDDPK